MLWSWARISYGLRSGVAGCSKAWSYCAVGEWRGHLPKGSCTFRGSDKDLDALWPALWQSGGAKERPVHSAACQRAHSPSNLSTSIGTVNTNFVNNRWLTVPLMVEYSLIEYTMAPSKNAQSTSAKNHKSEASGTRLLGNDLLIYLLALQFH